MDKATEKKMDRSIRTWGLQAQQNLLSSHILAIGYDPIMSEILKNVAISGVSKITIIDEFKGKKIPYTEALDKNNIFIQGTKEIRSENINNIKSVNTNLVIQTINLSDVNQEMINSVSIIVITLPDKNIIEEIQKYKKDIIYCNSVGGVGIFYRANKDINLIESITKSTPEYIGRHIIKKYFDVYNSMEEYSYEQLYSQLLEKCTEEEKKLINFAFNYTPINSIIGSLAAQETINVIGQLETYTNSEYSGFLYDSINNIGDILQLNPKKEVKKKEEVVHHIVPIDDDDE